MSSTTSNNGSSSANGDTNIKLKHLTESLPKLVLTSTNSSSNSSFNSSNGGNDYNMIPNGVNNGKSPSMDESNTSPTSLKAPLYKSNSKKIEFKDSQSLKNENDKDNKHAKPIRSISSDNDDAFIEGVLNAKDRRTSWQQVRTQRSYIPSLSAICK
jgi:hypothetical protein